MNIVLATKRRWNWKVFLVLVGLIIPAVFAIVPFDVSRQNAATGGDLLASIGWQTLVVDRLINALLIVVLGGMGLVLANRIGLGLPFVEGWATRSPIPIRFRNIAAIAWITAVALVLTSLLLRTLVIDPAMSEMFKEQGIPLPQQTPVAPLYGFLAAASAGITEESLFPCLPG